jgi:hypothetical protein
VTKRAHPLISSSIAICALAALCATTYSLNVEAGVGLEPQHQGMRDLLIRAITIGPVEAGKIRIPIPTDGEMYEVIISSPGVPRLIHVESSNAD